MSIRIMAAALAMTIVAAPAVAQTHTPQSDAISAATAPGTAAANDRAGARVAQRAGGQAVDQARYAEDMAAYGRAVRARHRGMVRDERTYGRQQRAYADAMADWRLQVAACRRGNTRMCRMPAPDPSRYF